MARRRGCPRKRRGQAGLLGPGDPTSGAHRAAEAEGGGASGNFQRDFSECFPSAPIHSIIAKRAKRALRVLVSMDAACSGEVWSRSSAWGGGALGSVRSLARSLSQNVLGCRKWGGGGKERGDTLEHGHGFIHEHRTRVCKARYQPPTSKWPQFSSYMVRSPSART